MLQQTHCDLLLNSLFPIAQQMLRSRGEFYPVGAFIDADGRVEKFADHNRVAESQRPTEMIKILADTAKAMAREGRCRAVGICFAVRANLPGENEKTDAILAALEDSDGALNVYLPFRKMPDSQIEFRPLFAEHAKPSIFVASF